MVITMENLAKNNLDLNSISNQMPTLKHIINQLDTDDTERHAH